MWSVIRENKAFVRREEKKKRGEDDEKREGRLCRERK